MDTEEGSKTAVLTDISLLNVAKALKTDDVQAFLLLNIPLTDVVTYYEEMLELDQKETAFNQRMIMRWKKMRGSKKDEHKVAELEQALRDSGHKELANILLECNRSNVEVTRDLIQS